MKTEQQIKNLEEALYVMWPSVPEANVAVALKYWQEKPWTEHCTADTKATCGTIACFGGWVALYPYFQAQGVFPNPVNGAPMMPPLAGSEVAEFLFGDADLFRTRGAHRADSGFFGTDHELVTNRLKYALSHKEESDNRNATTTYIHATHHN